MYGWMECTELLLTTGTGFLRLDVHIYIYTFSRSIFSILVYIRGGEGGEGLGGFWFVPRRKKIYSVYARISWRGTCIE